MGLRTEPWGPWPGSRREEALTPGTVERERAIFEAGAVMRDMAKESFGCWEACKKRVSWTQVKVGRRVRITNVL